MTALVTGGAGFIGVNLAERLAADGHDVVVFDNLSRAGVAANRAWLLARHPRRVRAVLGDVRDAGAVAAAMADAEVVFHLAGQTAVTTSMTDPWIDFAVNAQGTLTVLEAARKRSTPVLFASTNKVYGDLADVALTDADGAWRPSDPAHAAHGIGEDRPVDFHTPYGCSKGAADQYVLDYARSFGVPTAVLRMSCIYGPHQRGTEDQGWVAHFLLKALAGETISIFGDGRQVRDILYVDDAVAAYVAAWERISAVSGTAFNVGGGADNAVSLRQVLARIAEVTGSVPSLEFSDWRPGDQRYYVSDIRRVTAALGLPKPLGWQEGLSRLAGFYADEARAPEMRVAS